MAEASSPLYVIDGAFYTVVGCDSCNYNEVKFVYFQFIYNVGSKLMSRRISFVLTTRVI